VSSPFRRDTVPIHKRKESDVETTRARRSIPLVLTALVVLLSAVTALAVSNGHDALADGGARHQLTRRLRHHILIAAELIAAAKAGDQTGLAGAQARWEANADRIARVLHSLNPRGWRLAKMKRELRMHLKLTTEEVVARLTGDWEGDVAAYERIHRHALHFADLLSAGLVEQFPRRFR
jgi:hypothetical protein